MLAGTPGTGKSRLSAAVAHRTGLRWIDTSQEIIQHECYDGYDEELDTKILDEDKLLDILEPQVASGGVIIDYHGCDFFPERWFDVVYVLRTDNTVLYDRLTARGYSEVKIQNNVASEIFQTILEEAQGSYKEDIVHELRSDNEDEFQANVEIIVDWVKEYNGRPKRGT